MTASRRAAISVFDAAYFRYAVPMYISLRAFNPDLRAFAGDLGLTSTQRDTLAALGVTVLDTERAAVVRERGLHPTYGHFLLHRYLEGIDWDQALWIDADTLIVEPLDELFEYEVDLVGHGGRSSGGALLTLAEAFPHYDPRAPDWLARHLPVPAESLYFSGGVWCTRSKPLLELLDTLLDIVPPEIFPIEPPVFTAAIHHLGLSTHQLDSATWNFSRELLTEARLEDGALVYGDGIRPKTVGFSMTDGGTKAGSAPIEAFYRNTIRSIPWRRPLPELIHFVIAGGYTQQPEAKLRQLDAIVSQTVADGVAGDLVECGSWRGGSAAVILNAAIESDKTLHLFDTFEGMPPPSEEDFTDAETADFPGRVRGEGGDFGAGSLADTSPQVVRDLVDLVGFDADRVRVNQTVLGHPPASDRLLQRRLSELSGHARRSRRRAEEVLALFPDRISVLHIDVDFYEPYRWVLEKTYARVAHGGAIVFDDYGYWVGAKRAVEEFLQATGEQLRHTDGTSQSYVVKSQRLFVDLDDFCEEYMTSELWDLLTGLRERYPDFKVSMFTIPGKCSPGWLRWVKDDHPWIEMILHGTHHTDRDEWLVSGAEAVEKVKWLYNPEVYAKGFKAPWWRLSPEAYDGLRRAGFFVATNKTNPYAKPTDPLNYAYDDGSELLPDVHYRRTWDETWHGHVPPQREFGSPFPNGLEEVYDRLIDAWPRDVRFGVISDLFR